MLAKFKYKSDFVKNVITLMTGTTIAQAIPILFSPVITRLFKPEDFGLLALYISISMIVSLAGTGMYAHAIVLAEKEEDAASIFTLCCIIAVALSLVTLLFIILFNGRITDLLNNKAIAYWLYLIPLTVFLNGFYQALSYWTNRQTKYKRLAVSRVGQSCTATTSQLLMRFLKAGPSGLILGFINGQLISAGLLSWQVWKDDRKRIQLASRERIRQQAKYYRRFPIYSLPTEFINVTTNQVPVLLLTTLAGPAAVGFYSLALRLLGMPVNLISSSAVDVFKQRASSDYVKYGNCRDIYLKTLKSMALVSIVPFGLLIAFAPILFAFVFGERWREAGEYTRFLSIMYFFSFTVSPLSYVYYIAGRQREDLLLHGYMVVSTILSLYLGYHIFGKPLYMILCFSINYSIIYIIYLFRSYSFAKGNATTGQVMAAPMPMSSSSANHIA